MYVCVYVEFLLVFARCLFHMYMFELHCCTDEASLAYSY